MMDWEGIATAYLDRERARLGLPSRMQEMEARQKREQAAALATSQLESAALGREKTRAEIEALPADAELRHAAQRANIAQSEAAAEASRALAKQRGIREPIEVSPGATLARPGEDGDYKGVFTAPLTPGQRMGGMRPRLVNTVDESGNPIQIFVTPSAGASFAPGDTAEMRNKKAGRELATHSVSVVQALGDRIITKIGPAQRLAAIQRGAEAVYGTDPEFRAYQDARMALAGNLAVAQQGSRPSDADIRAIWLPMVPDAFRDTSESAAIKWDLIKQMQVGPRSAAPSPSQPSRLSPGAAALMDAWKARKGAQ